MRTTAALAFFDRFVQDLRFGARMIARAPALTAVVTLTLALGIGATTAVFSILQAVLMRPLPYREPDRLVAIWDGHVREQALSKIFASYEDYETWKQHSRSFEQFAAVTWATGPRILSGRGTARVVLDVPATVDLFDLLGTSAPIGRTFRPDDLNRGCSVVLSHRFWQQTLGAQPDVVGESLTLDDRACLVLGVMPAGFEFYPTAADMWSLIQPGNPLANGVAVFGRLRPGVSLARAQAELRALHRPAEGPREHSVSFVPTIYPLQSEFTWLAGRNLRSTLVVLFAAVGFVLLIACLNVTNVLLGRSVARQRELAVRAALGSGRARLVRQLLTEGLLLSSIGAVLGVLLAVAAVHYFRTINPVELPPGSTVAVDLRVLGFTAILAVSTSLFLGVAPAWRAFRVDVASVIKGDGPALSDHPRRRMLSNVLVVAQIVCSVVLLVGAGLLIESIGRLGSTPLGFDADGLLTMMVKLPRTKYAQADRRVRFYEQMTTALEGLPGGQEVALSTTFTSGRGSNVLLIDGRPAPSAEAAVPDVSADFVSPDYFRVMKVPLRSGREFTSTDRTGSEAVAIVNEQLARTYFPDESPVGKRIKYGSEPEAPWLTIVGVVANQKGTNLHQEMDWIETPLVFRPVLQTAPSDAVLLLRSAVDPLHLSQTVQARVAALDADVPLSDVKTMRARISEDLAHPRFRAVLLAGFAGLALLLAVVGLYGVLAQQVARRTQEIGIRVALGAQRGTVLLLVAKQSALLVGSGLVFGLIGASWLGRFIGAMLYGVRSTDPAMWGLVSLSLTLAALVATYLPARRAMQIDPIVALRRE